jgi:hypothetical protein
MNEPAQRVECYTGSITSMCRLCIKLAYRIDIFATFLENGGSATKNLYIRVGYCKEVQLVNPPCGITDQASSYNMFISWACDFFLLFFRLEMI